MLRKTQTFPVKSTYDVIFRSLLSRLTVIIEDANLLPKTIVEIWLNIQDLNLEGHLNLKYHFAEESDFFFFLLLFLMAEFYKN